MERKLLYAFRGWIAFVAFMDLGTAFRSYIEKRSFLGDHLDASMNGMKLVMTFKFTFFVLKYISYFFYFISGDFTISRILGMYCILKAIALVHCTLYIHFKP